MERVVYTIGHSNHALDVFLALLRQHEIEVLVDTRSRPHSTYVPHFNHDVLRPVAANAGLRFVFLGNELGGRPDGADYYDERGHVLYDRVAQRADFQQGVVKVEKGAASHKIAMLCSEENPATCHRRLLVGRVLGERGTKVLHIRGDGRLQSEAELEAEETGADAAQPSLFDREEGRAWKSTQSVSRKRPPGSSSRR
jgi:uncharacterized protein (DUF488 family)